MVDRPFQVRKTSVNPVRTDFARRSGYNNYANAAALPQIEGHKLTAAAPPSITINSDISKRDNEKP